MSEAAPSLSVEAPPVAPALEAVPAPAPAAVVFTRRDLAIMGALALAFAAVRLPIFPFAENLYGDAVVRSEIAERWADDPHLIRHFKDGVYQFGPLHFYAMGAALKVWPSREHATRLVSLLFGLLLVLPLYRLGVRLFSRRAAVVACLAASVWTLHIQASTTAASEAFSLTLFVFALDFLVQGLQEARFRPLLWSALFLNLAAATRYDVWMYAPLFTLVVAFWGEDRIASFTRAVIFGPLTLAFPLWWMQQNEKFLGDALYPIHYIDEFHARWVNDGVAWLGETKFRLHNLLFWPGSLVVTASVLVGLFALAGIVRAFVKKEQRSLAWLIVLPTAYFAFRGAVLMNFSPLARFTMIQVALALLFVVPGFDWVCGRLPAGGRRVVAGLTGALAVATPLWLGQYTAWKTGMWQETLRPIAPLSTVPLDQSASAKFLKEHVAPGELVVVDEDPRYTDITVTFFTGLPEKQLARRRWDTFEKQLASGEPKWLFTLAGGTLAKELGWKVGEPTLELRGATFEKVDDRSGLTVYERR